MYGQLMKIFSCRKCVDLHGVSTPFLYFFYFMEGRGRGHCWPQPNSAKMIPALSLQLPRHLLWQYLRVI